MTAGGRRLSPRSSREALCLAILLLGLPCSADPAGEISSAGVTSFAGARYVEAAGSFRRVVTEFPRSREAEQAGYLLGVSLFLGDRGEESLAALAAFRQRHPRSPLIGRSSYWLGAANLKLGRYQKALALLADFAAGGDRSSYAASTSLLSGMALEGLGRDAEAASLYRKVLDDPSAAPYAEEARFRLAGIEMRAGRFGPARDLYDRIVLASTASPWVRDSLFFLAECELSLGNPAEADRRYRTMLAVYPDSPWREAATFRLADAAWRLGSPGPALALAGLYLEQYPSGGYRGSAYRLRADIARQGKDFEQAIVDYVKAAQLLGDGGERAAAWYSEGQSQLASDREADAARSFGLAAREGRGRLSEKAGFQAAVLVAGLGHEKDAVGALEAGIRGFPDGDYAQDSLKLLASLLEKSGDHEGAVARWTTLIDRFPRSAVLPEALFRRAGILTVLGRAAAALDDYQRIVSRFPSSPWKKESLYAIGYSYAQRGEYPRALPYFQTVAQDPHAGATGELSRLSIGICLFDMGSFARAAAALQDLLAAGPTTVPRERIVLFIGRSLYRMERLDEAAQRFDEVLRLVGEEGASADAADAGSAQAHAADAADAAWWLGWSTLRLGRIVEARDAFLVVARQHPTDPRALEALYRAAVCETLRYDDEAAVGLFNAVLEAPRANGDAAPVAAQEAARSSAPDAAADAAGPIREQALYGKGWALSRLQRPAESAVAFEQLAHEFPSGRMAPAAVFKLAEAALDRQAYAESKTGFRRVARDFPASPYALQSLYWSAEAARRGGDARGSLEDYWACLTAGADSGLLESTLDGFRAAMRAVDDLDLARSFADRARTSLGLSPDAVAGVQLAYAELLLSSSPADAFNLISQVRGGAPSEPRAGEANLLIGKYYAVSGDWSRALAVFTALEGSRGDEVGARAARERGLALEATGRTAEAINELVGISSRFPGFEDLAAEALSQARRIALNRGDIAWAARIAETIRTDYPASPWARQLAQPP